jgi:hypothetical protein
MRVFENSVVRSIFVPKRERERERGGWINLHIEEFHGLYFRQIIFG